MATARSTTNSDIHSQLNGYVTDYLTKHMYDANTSWPLRKTIRLPKQTELEAHYTHIRAQDEAIRNWAQQHHCETSEKTKIISNGIVRQTSQLIDSVTIPDLNTALNITTPQTRKLYQREHQRAHTITNQFNLDSNTSINIAKILKNHDDTDFNLVIQAAHYFANHNTENITPTHGPHPRIQRKMARQNNIKPLQSNLQTPQTRTTSPQRPPRRNPTPTPRHTTPQPTRPHRDTTMDRRRATRHHPHHHRGKQRHLPSHTHNRTRHLHIRQRTRGNPNQNTTTLDHNHTPHHLLGRHRRRRPRNTLRTTTNRHHLRLHTHGQHSIQNIRTIRHQTRHQKTTPQNTRPQTNTRTHATRKKLIRTTLHREKHNLPTNRTRTHPHQRRNDNTPQPTPMEHNTPQIEHLFEIITKMRYPKQLEQRTTTSGGKPWQPNATTQQTATS